jgi:hypothetical protein
MAVPPREGRSALKAGHRGRRPASPLWADIVEKLENRRAPKISQMSRIGDFSRCKAL